MAVCLHSLVSRKKSSLFDNRAWTRISCVGKQVYLLKLVTVFIFSCAYYNGVPKVQFRKVLLFYWKIFSIIILFLDVVAVGVLKSTSASLRTGWPLSLTEYLPPVPSYSTMNASSLSRARAQLILLLFLLVAYQTTSPFEFPFPLKMYNSLFYFYFCYTILASQW